jgi:N-acyl-D-aspartate/D-glutamate deacylase
MTVLIKNGLVYDGSGDEPVKEDVLIPGFIDINSSADHYLTIFDGDFARSSEDGVTTVIGGNCGASLAPSLNRSLLSLRKWADVSKLNVDWHDFAELFEHLEKKKLNVNFGTLVGHGTIRWVLLGEETRDLAEGEIESAKKILKRALDDGVLGFSTGLEFVHEKSTPVHEIEELVSVVSKKKRVYATHLRDYGAQLGASVEEAIRIAKKTGVNLEISHFMPRISEARDYSLLREKIEVEGAKLRINFDCNSLPYIPVSIYQLLPEWLKKESSGVMLEHLNAEHLEEKILEHLRKLSSENIYFGEMPPHLDFLNGKNLRDYAVSNNLTPAKAMLKLMRISNLRGVLLKQSVEEDLIEDFVFSPSSFIASGEMKKGRVFMEFLKFADRSGKISMEKAVAKITAQPAEKYGLKWRGKIEEGYYADLLIIKDGAVKDSIVNGGVLIEEGEFQNSRTGKILKYVS